MSANQLIALDQATDAQICGHKAAALADLIEHGFDVPPGFVIPVDATPDRAAIAAALDELGGGPVAVRSSGVSEDLDDASFAGQYESVLNVVGVDDVIAAAARCVASATAEHVSKYAGGEPISHGMAVLVQRMVPADSAGVAFSADPIAGDRDVVVINAVRGLADRLVAGEIDGDVWRVDADGAHVGVEPHGAIDEALAERLAAIAREIERLRGAPQDIEWACADGELFVVQARPITVLPVAPIFDLPVGTWEKDSAHFPDPVCPFAASTHLHPDVGSDMLPDVGLMLDGIEARVVGHEVYLHIEPDDGGAKPPPWWAIGIAVRLVPSFRRKMRKAEETFRSGFFEDLPRRWNERLADEQRAEIQRRAGVDLQSLSDDEFFEYVRGLRAFAAAGMKLHFELMIPHVLGTAELCQTCEELLGWSVGETSRLLQGLSVASAAPVHELGEIAELVRTRPAARQIVEAGGMNFIDAMREADPQVHRLLEEYLDTWGIRTFGPDCSAPNVSDRPDLLAGSLAALLDQGGLDDLEPDRQQLIAEARAAIADQDDLARFDKALAYAELVYPIREDNVILTDQMIIGLARLAGLEAGRRLVRRGLARTRDDAMMLSAEEIEQHLADGEDARPLIARRRSELAWVRAHPGPVHYGPAPVDPPSMRGLPQPARRINEALLFALAEELSQPPRRTSDAVTGIAASPGTYRGRARVITSVADLHKLQQGEILVCPSTTAAWMMVFHRAGAIVTDVGSVLTHTSIVAREHRLPAVVGTHDATSEFVDGEELIVDGTAGTVTRVA